MMIEVKKTNCNWSSEDSGDLTKHCYVTMISYIVLQGLVKLRYAKLLAFIIYYFTWQHVLMAFFALHEVDELKVLSTYWGVWQYPFTGSHNISEQSMSTYKTQWTQITSYLLSIFHSFPYIPTIYKIEITQQSVICL